MQKIKTPIKSIRAKCLDCSCDSSKEVELCWDKNCALYPYRMGKHPLLKGKGNPNQFKSINEKKHNTASDILPNKGDV